MFFRDLHSFGDTTALISGHGQRVSYSELVRQADAFAATLGPRRCLVALEMRNDTAAIAAYLGALRAGFPVILLAEGAAEESQPIVQTFRPEKVYCRRDSGWVLEERRSLPEAFDLHAELAVMLSTSGTTGSPKLVRLSHANLHENARSIAEYLQLAPDRRAITNLPLHYSYGLSVLNSHLLCGASLVVTDLSVVESDFWQLFSREKVTDLPGVPYTYELFEKTGLRQYPPASLRVMTQAGGRLSPDLVRSYAEFARDKGIRFFVMYGQTEATARMAYLPPEKTLENSDCIGVAIPRGRFEIRDAQDAPILAPGQSGELVYHGPNVMMGYALGRPDLATGPGLQELKTGDIAQWSASGFVKIVGRASRFSKIAGLRIGLDDIERMLRESGRRGYVAGNDAVIAVAMIDDSDPAAIRAFLAERCKLPPRHLQVFATAHAPTLPSGKVDYVSIRTTGESMLASESAQAASSDDPLRSLYARALSVAHVTDSATFSSLGGDSLSYVEVSRGLETVLGTLPQHWERMSLRELKQLRSERQSAGPAPAEARTALSIDVFLRLLAVSLVFIGHGAPEHTEWLRGGTGILFCLAGYSLCRFQREQLLAGHVAPALLGAFRRIVIPYLLIMTGLIVITGMKPHTAWWTLTSVFQIDRNAREVLFSYWFIETLLHCLVITSAVVWLPAIRRRVARRPFASAAVGVAAAAIVFALGEWRSEADAIRLTVDAWLYAYLIGWAMHLANRLWHKVALIAVGGAITLVQFGAASSRPYWFMFGLIVLGSVSSLHVTSRWANLLSRLAAAVYLSYLLHPVVTHVTKHQLPTQDDPLITIVLTYAGTLAAGLLATAVWQRLTNAAVTAWRHAHPGSRIPAVQSSS